MVVIRNMNLCGIQDFRNFANADLHYVMIGRLHIHWFEIHNGDPSFLYCIDTRTKQMLIFRKTLVDVWALMNAVPETPSLHCNLKTFLRTFHRPFALHYDIHWFEMSKCRESVLGNNTIVFSSTFFDDDQTQPILVKAGHRLNVENHSTFF